ncbi:MAG: peptide MFS transporter [Pseudonocardia sp.]|uniref:peptide MFS transporter n=1 Tax=unclassified Pseudonocardia TaxID=2619320 RepID=UPI00086A7458|nr:MULTISPECIES: peptide MFS transporter [unclassified Pseudonocardia]MBN9113113.1 peptide MFS transporter [Pseudonocardia sp.]ODU07877.1 MAG: MFS transporter [Pseudonocardia sp. SCN 72-51]ODV00242.1 MAG: MFS transporter [Pseudonocardia sp. SCN 73-27]
MSDVAERPTRPEPTFFGQPRTLASLFGVEMWERFSFYGMQGILLIYLYYSVAEGGLGVDRGVATGIVGAYGGLVYLSTILGAWLADRVLGPERVLFYAAIVVMLGHIALSALPGLLGVGVGLVLIAVGSGGVKATATSLVGTLYDADDPRRDAGFSLFYLGINLGALVGPLLTGLLQSTAGFHWGFALAAVGMALGLIQYSFGRKHLPDSAREVPSPLAPRERTIAIAAAVVVAVVIVVLALTGVLAADRLDLIVIGVTIVAAIAYFALLLTSRKVDKVERKRVLAFVPLFLASTVFWSLYQQQFTVLTIYSDTRLDRDLFGWEMPVAWVQSINPVFIIVLSGVFTVIWTKLGNRAPSTPIKFALGVAIVGVGFLLFLPMAGGGPNSAPLLGIVGILFVFTIGELLLSPVGLSVSTKLAPEAYRTQMVALFFLSIALGTALSGTLAGYYSAENEVAYFGILGAVAIAAGLVLLAITPFVRRLMSGVR